MEGGRRHMPQEEGGMPRLAGGVEWAQGEGREERGERLWRV